MDREKTKEHVSKWLTGNERRIICEVEKKKVITDVQRSSTE